MAIQIDNLKGEKVYDPYNNKENFYKYFEKKVSSIPAANADLIRQYVDDMRCGKNVTGRKGQRGYHHLNTLLSRIILLSKIFSQRYNKYLTELEANDLHETFQLMRDGTIKKAKGEGKYKSVHDYIKIFKAFWHWYIKVQRKKGIIVEDITIDLSACAEHKPDFVYFTIDSLKKLMDHAKFEYRVLMIFLFDSGVRTTEMLNVKRKDFTNIPGSDKLYLNIRVETSKTFGRKIKLMLSCDLLKEYFNTNNFSGDDFIFRTEQRNINAYLKRLSQKVFGNNLKKLNENTGTKKHITIYDFRHSSCCYWLPRYKSESALIWRFGWMSSKMIHYYSEFLGMKDTIEEGDMLVDVTKTEIEKALEHEKGKTELLQERMNAQEKMLAKLQDTLNALKNEKK